MSTLLRGPAGCRFVTFVSAWVVLVLVLVILVLVLARELDLDIVVVVRERSVFQGQEGQYGLQIHRLLEERARSRRI